MLQSALVPPSSQGPLPWEAATIDWSNAMIWIQLVFVHVLDTVYNLCKKKTSQLEYSWNLESRV